jgi:hypothetical protein
MKAITLGIAGLPVGTMRGLRRSENRNVPCKVGYSKNAPAAHNVQFLGKKNMWRVPAARRFGVLPQVFGGNAQALGDGCC